MAGAEESAKANEVCFIVQTPAIEVASSGQSAAKTCHWLKYARPNLTEKSFWRSSPEDQNSFEIVSPESLRRSRLTGL